jgi:NADH dehydrogenase FAD-containing subunit
MESAPPRRILILGGGFADLTVAMEWEKKLAQDPSVEITLINRENFFLFTPTWPGVWALGDCSTVPDRRKGGFHPPIEQHALRQARIVAHNIIASIRGSEQKRFDFSTIAQLAAIGRRTGVANILGFNFSGFFAWWLWRTIYLSKLPRLEKKLRVAFDWTLDLIFSKYFVQFLDIRAPMVSRPEEAAPSHQSKWRQPELRETMRAQSPGQVPS